MASASGRGTRFTTDIFRGSPTGPRETVVEVDRFDFENQRMYVNDPPIEVRPGDTIRTTCTYANPSDQRVYLGERTEDEMCFNFVMIYPISSIQGDRSCGLL